MIAVVTSPAEAAARLGDGPGDPAGPLELRARAALGPAWEALGFTELARGELTCPLPVHLPDVAATRALGARLAAVLRPGDLLVLTGALGAGKTALVQGLGAALGVAGRVTSPTFVLARAHRGPLPLVHVDAYRLLDAPDPAAALRDLDLDDAAPSSVTVVEWGAGLVEGLAEARLEIALAAVPQGGRTSDTGDGGRTAAVRAHGPRWSVVQPP